MNKGELYSRVESYLEATETTFVANLDTFVKLAEEDIYRQVQLPELRKNATSAFTIGSPYLLVPSDYLSSYSMAVIVGSEQRFLTSKEVDFMRETFPSPNTTGIPRFFSMFDGEVFIVAPTPAENYGVELHYFFRPQSLSLGGDSDTTWLSQNAENALLFGTLMHGYIFLKGDQDVMVSYKGQFDKAIMDLRTIAEGRNRKDSYRNIDKRTAV